VIKIISLVHFHFCDRFTHTGNRKFGMLLWQELCRRIVRNSSGKVNISLSSRVKNIPTRVLEKIDFYESHWIAKTRNSRCDT
jgi:hypothetical protein